MFSDLLIETQMNTKHFNGMIDKLKYDPLQYINTSHLIRILSIVQVFDFFFA